MGSREDDDCVEWTGCRGRDGYGRRTSGEGGTLAHRVAFFEAHGYLPEVVRHSCDNPPCVNVDHLLPGTQFDNMRDMVERGRQNDTAGEGNGRSVLTGSQALEILETYQGGGVSQLALASEYGVSQKTIWRVVKGKSWKKITAGKIESTG